MNKDAPVKLLLIDVYGTLMDISDVKKKINRILDTKRGYTIWSEMLLHYSLVDNATVFHPYREIAFAAMQMAAKSTDMQVSSKEFEEVMELFKHLHLQEGVQEGLSILQDYDIRLAALSNFSTSIVSERMEKTGLISYFEMIFSAEETKKYKPDPEAYRYASTRTGCDLNEILMVTSHGWDVCGAMNVGMKAAYIEKGGEWLYPLSPDPTFKAKNFADLAGQLVKVEHG